MPTILEVLNKTKDFFESKGIENARLNAELIIAKRLECKRLDLYLRYEEFLEEQVIRDLRELVSRRSKREPLQHILGTVEFCGLTLKADSRALIPRPETEYLVELLTEKAKNDRPKKILELGTGSGAISLALAQIWHETEITATDISREALDLARENALNNNLEDKVTFVESDWFDSLHDTEYDLIISNPPYLTSDEWKNAEPEVKDFDPIQALVSANEGLSDLEHILTKAINFLKPSGMIALETGIKHHDQLTALSVNLKYARCESIQDLSKRKRFFIAFK